MTLLKNLFRQQKKLIIIFLFTIVLPSLALSTFGILAIKNEKYRLEQKILEEQQNAMMLLKKQFSNQLKIIEELLENTAQLTAFSDKDYTAMRKNLNLILTKNQPVDQVFVIFEEGEAFFPLLQNAPDVTEILEPSLTSIQKSILTRSRKAEFVNQDFGLAITLYTELFNRVSEYNLKAQMLNDLARVQKKSGKIVSATDTYKRIIEQYPLSLTSSKLPLVITAELQLIDCNRNSGNKKQALARALTLYEKILNGEMNLNENQFHMYTEMSTEIINKLIYKEQVFSSNQDLRKNYDILKKKYRLRAKQWKDRKQIEVEIIPSLKELKNQSKTRSFHFSRRIQREDFLITAVPISGMLCVKWNNDRMIREWLQPIVDNLFLNERFNVVITDLNGGILLGEAHQKKDPISVTSEFDDYFPPWKIQISRVSSNNELGINLFKNYYFWSILTLLMILIFGTSLLIRTISREREIIAIKSDFIASVSHELKTPLTSIKALTERLIAGKVKSPEKMHEYFTIIEQDANKLTQLVKNTLDFSKIEEGKKEYIFESTDITSWLNRTIDEFNNDYIPERIETRKNFDPEIPSISIDRDAISQCLNNLLDNAIKFSPDSRFVEVYLKKDPDFVIIEVKDWGIGIPKENLHRIFDKFFQGPPSTQQSVKGTGLGLALVKHAIEAHNGRIEVQSSLGQGSTFTIFVPIVNPKL